MGPRSMFPCDHQSYMLWGCPLCELHAHFCCGGTNYCGCTGRWGWPPAWLAARLCLVRWLQAHWWAGQSSCMVGSTAAVPGWGTGLLLACWWAVWGPELSLWAWEGLGLVLTSWRAGLCPCTAICRAEGALGWCQPAGRWSWVPARLSVQPGKLSGNQILRLCQIQVGVFSRTTLQITWSLLPEVPDVWLFLWDDIDGQCLDPLIHLELQNDGILILSFILPFLAGILFGYTVVQFTQESQDKCQILCLYQCSK